jgi:glycosyltransferase involved in cell wall biosynthesis
MQKIALVIPCYNEASRWSESSLQFIIDESDLHLILVDDGSTDQTINLMRRFSNKHQSRVTVLQQETNTGKASAVRMGFVQALAKNDFTYIGFTDADFATPPAEVIRFANLLRDSTVDFILGSRIKKLGTSIHRSNTRHLIGRVIATAIEQKFKLGIYDTQCGLKFFTRESAQMAFSTAFRTKWLFDVEIILRMKENYKGKEIPLLQWNAMPGSKIHAGHALRIVMEIIQLLRHYTHA